MRTAQILRLVFMLTLSICAIAAQQISGSVSGRVTDQMDTAVAGATLMIIRKDGAEKRSVTNGQGIYSAGGLAPGLYKLRIEAAGFGAYENDQVKVQAGSRQTLDITLMRR